MTCFGNYMAYLENIRHQHELFTEPQAVRLRELLQLTRLRDAFDGRDKVYALLGLMQHLPNQLPIVPDYSKTLSEVYVQTAIILITHFKTLDILVTVQRKPKLRKSQHGPQTGIHPRTTSTMTRGYTDA